MPTEIPLVDGDALAAQLLATKLLVPPVAPEVVPRPRLVERLTEATRRAVTVVAAPAGFGKTTAVAAWIAETAPQVAWLTLDAGDNELGRFLVHLAGAVRGRWPEAAGPAVEQLTRHPLRPALVLGALLNRLSEVDAQLTLVLDELEVLDSPDVLDAVAFVLEHQPPNLHLLLCTRGEPHLPLPRLRARSQLAEVGVEDLRFTLDEAARYLEEAMSLRVSSAGRQALYSRTEGWITGLQLAALSLRRTPDRDRFISSFAGDHRHVADYLMDEVLRSLSGEVQEFLLTTSVLPRLCGDLCDAVTGGSGSGAVLEQLAEDHLFVQRLDEQRRWYRYHTLFAELLSYRLAARDAAAAKDLHRRAATWFDEHGLVAEAIHHALAASDTEMASTLVEVHGQALLARGESRAAIAWFAALPDEAFVHRPELGVLHGLALLAARDVDGAARRLELVERRIGELPPSQGQTVRRFLRIVEAAVHLFRDDIGRAMELAVAAEEAAGELPPSLVGAAESVLAFAHHARGDMRQARGYAQRGLARGMEHDVPRAVLHMGTMLARIDLREGHLRQAETTCREILELAVEKGWWEVSFRSAPQLALAETLYEGNALAEAEDVLVSALEVATRLGPDEHEDLAVEWLARLRLARGEVPAPVAVDPARAAVAEYHLHLFDPLSYHRLWRRLAAGEAVAVESELRRGDLDPYAPRPDPARERQYLLLARALVARGRASEAGLLLSRLVLAAEAEGRFGTALEALCLQAVGRHMQGSTSQAHDALRRALELVGEEPYTRVFLDLGPPMLHLLRRADPSGKAGRTVERLLEAFGEAPVVAVSAVAALAEPIRERELDVLRCIAAGMSNQEIAAQLYLSTNTVKTHVRNLYGKLGVQRRSQAILRARELGLITQ